MRLAVLIIGLLLGLLMFLQTFLVNVLSQAGNNEAAEQAAAVGILMSILWLAACAFVLPFPFVSVVLFVIAGLLGFAMSGEFTDLGIWGGISLFLAVLSFLGWLGKRRERRQFKVERERQAGRDTRMEALLEQRAQAQTSMGQVTCPSCGRTNPAGTRFCGNCGTALTTLST